MMTVDITAETFGFVENIGARQTAREGILTTNYFFVAVSYTHLHKMYKTLMLCILNIISLNIKQVKIKKIKVLIRSTK